MRTRREHFRTSLTELEQEVLELGDMVKKAILGSVEALKKRDVAASKRIINADVKVNHKRWEIEDKGIALIATQQPVAYDLREIIGLLSIIVDLERMGDHAEGIAQINVMMSKEPLLKPLVDIPKMAAKAADMLERSLKAFVDRDAESAKQISVEDDEVDELYNQVYAELVDFMIKDPDNIERATHLLWAAHNLERTADRATNICERVVFLVTGRLGETQVSRY